MEHNDPQGGTIPVYFSGPCFGDSTPSEVSSSPNPQEAVERTEYESAMDDNQEADRQYGASQEDLLGLGTTEDLEETHAFTPHGRVHEDLLDLDFSAPPAAGNLGEKNPFGVNFGDGMFRSKLGRDDAAEYGSENRMEDSKHDHGSYSDDEYEHAENTSSTLQLGAYSHYTDEEQYPPADQGHSDRWTGEEWRDRATNIPSSSPPPVFSSSPLASSQTSYGDFAVDDAECEETDAGQLGQRFAPLFSRTLDEAMDEDEEGDYDMTIAEDERDNAAMPDFHDHHQEEDEELQPNADQIEEERLDDKAVVERVETSTAHVTRFGADQNRDLDDPPRVDVVFSPSTAPTTDTSNARNLVEPSAVKEDFVQIPEYGEEHESFQHHSTIKSSSAHNDSNTTALDERAHYASHADAHAYSSPPQPSNDSNEFIQREFDADNDDLDRIDDCEETASSSIDVKPPALRRTTDSNSAPAPAELGAHRILASKCEGRGGQVAEQAPQQHVFGATASVVSDADPQAPNSIQEDPKDGDLEFGKFSFPEEESHAAFQIVNNFDSKPLENRDVAPREEDEALFGQGHPGVAAKGKDSRDKESSDPTARGHEDHGEETTKTSGNQDGARLRFPWEQNVSPKDGSGGVPAIGAAERKPSQRAPTLPPVPNPKRCTPSGQLNQQKKLSKPFRCPTVVAKPSSTKVEGTSRLVPPAPAPAPSAKTDNAVHRMPDAETSKKEEDSKIRHRTQRASAQFKSPLTIPSNSGQALIRPTPTIQALEIKAQTLKRALRVVRDKEEATLQNLIAKWTEGGREVAYELWMLVKDSATEESSGNGWGEDAGVGKKRKIGENWGWDDGNERKKTMSESGSSWGWDPVPVAEDDAEHAEREYDASEEYSEENGGEKTHETIGTMLMRLGICPATLGWDEEEGCFVDKQGV